jgi:hypothetical protein
MALVSGVLNFSAIESVIYDEFRIVNPSTGFGVRHYLPQGKAVHRVNLF